MPILNLTILRVSYLVNLLSDAGSQVDPSYNFVIFKGSDLNWVELIIIRSLRPIKFLQNNLS